MKIREWIAALRGKISRLTPWQGVLLGVLALLVVVSLWISVRIYEGGLLSVSVAGDCIPGGRIYFAIPGALISTLMPVVVPEEARFEMAAHAECWLPVARLALDELQRCPDFVLASVETPAEFVRVEKRGRHLLFLVDVDEMNIRAKIPLGSLRLMLQSLTPCARARGPVT